jgi:hypothetical protein
MINEHDITKRILESIRKSAIFGNKEYGNNLIKENEEASNSFSTETTQEPTETGSIKTEFTEEEVESSIENEEEEGEDTGLNTSEGQEERIRGFFIFLY